MIDEQKCKEILLKIVNDSTRGWSTKPEFDVVCESLGCAIIAVINDEKRVQVAAFRRSELDNYLAGSHHSVQIKIETKLLQLQRKFSY